MKYFVTFTAIDGEYGNPFWHSFLLLSQTNKDNQIEVVDNWGFYGLPTPERSSFISKIKIYLKLDVDLYGNHGMLTHEELRFLDLGTALHGVTFELTQEKFDLLQKKCLKMVEEQNQAISEVVDSQKIKGKNKSKTRIYPHEQYSRVIYEIENIKAKQDNRESRLKPFELNLTLTPFGPAFNTAHTCKSQVIKLLTDILSEKQINRLTVGGKHPTLPIYSGTMEQIYLYSSGPLLEHKKSTGKSVYYRSFENAESKLHWTLPPQEIESLDNETIKLFEISKQYEKEVKEVIHQLQGIEWIFINSELPEKYKNEKENLIQHIRDHFRGFSFLNDINNYQSKSLSALQNFGYQLFCKPRNSNEEKLLINLNKAKNLINNIYMAMVDNWKIYDDCSFERPLNNLDKTNEDYLNPLEALAMLLTTQEKKILCKLINRNYIAPEQDESNIHFIENK